MSNINSFKSFIKINQERILFVVIVILVSLISFRAGQMKEKELKTSQIEVNISQNKPLTEDDKKALALGVAAQRKGLTENLEGISVVEDASKENCKFVGSKNSDKYHTPDCQWATRIKEENRVCFESEEDAKVKGYVPGSCFK